MKGLLIFEKNHDLQVLTFVCDVCKEEHSIFVHEGEPFVKTFYDGTGKSHNINIWGYKKGENSIIVDQFLLFDNAVFHPSFDNSVKCGFHSAANWKVEIKTINEDEIATDEMNHWLHN